MKRRDIIMVVLAVTTASAIGYGINGSESARELSKEANELTKTIQESKAEIESLIDKNEILNKNIEEQNKTIENQQIKLDKTLEELEFARQRIEKINAKVSFNHINALDVSGATEVHMRRALKGTGLEDVADAFALAEQEYGVNALLLAAIAAQESSWGTSDRSIYQNNLTGHAVYNSGAKGTYFSSRSESVMSTAKLLKNEYLSPGGSSFNGYSVEDINKRYCFLEDGKTIDYKWSSSITKIAYDLKNKANNF